MKLSEDNKFESISCDSCGSSSAKPVYHFAINERNVDIVECIQCGLDYLNPRPSADAIEDFYEDNYYSYALDEAGSTRETGLKARLKVAYMADFLGYTPHPDCPALAVPKFVSRLLGRILAVPRFVPGGRLLDVGCGAGDKLMEFRSLGWSVNGLELSTKAANAGATRGLDIRVGTLDENNPFADEAFDAITFYHSLEHLPSPNKALETAFQLLKPGGEVLIVVPNFGSLERRIFGQYWNWVDVPRHFYHFTKQTLTHCVRRRGFDVVSVGDSLAGQSIGRANDGWWRPVSLLVTAMPGLFAISSSFFGSGKAIILSARKPLAASTDRNRGSG